MMTHAAMGGEGVNQGSIVQQDVDEHGDVGDIDTAVAINVPVGHVGTVEHAEDENGHVGDVDHTVAVNVAAQGIIVLGRGHNAADEGSLDGTAADDVGLPRHKPQPRQ